MTQLTAHSAFSLSALSFPSASAFGFLDILNANSFVFSTRNGGLAEFFGPVSSSSPFDFISKITIKTAEGAALYTFDDLDGIWEGELSEYLGGTTKGALAYLLEWDDVIKLSSGNDVISGYEGDDTISGGAGADRLLGAIGSDRIMGGAGADKLDGGAGKDWLAGDGGLDTLTGGAGRDSFVFRVGPIAASNTDKITDFNSVDDSILLENAAFTSLTTAGPLNAANFVAGLAAKDANDFVIYSKATGSLWYDQDGKGGVAQVLIADLADGAVLTLSDLIII